MQRSAARLARGLSVATTLQLAGKGPNIWICAWDTSSVPAERDCTPLPAASLPARPKLLLLHLLSSLPPQIHRWVTAGPPPNLYAMLQHSLTHRRIHILGHIKGVPLSKCISGGWLWHDIIFFYTHAKWILAVLGNECPSSQKHWANVTSHIQKSDLHIGTTDTQHAFKQMHHKANTCFN